MLGRGFIGGVDWIVGCKRGDLMDENCGSDYFMIDYVEDSEMVFVFLVLVCNFSI